MIGEKPQRICVMLDISFHTQELYNERKCIFHSIYAQQKETKKSISFSIIGSNSTKSAATGAVMVKNDKSILHENLKYQTQRKEIVSLSACGCVVGYMLLGAAVGPFGSDQLFITSSPSLEGSSSSSYRSQQRAH